jgi:hypothetical protein
MFPAFISLAERLPPFRQAAQVEPCIAERICGRLEIAEDTSYAFELDAAGRFDASTIEEALQA